MSKSVYGKRGVAANAKALGTRKIAIASAAAVQGSGCAGANPVALQTKR